MHSKDGIINNYGRALIDLCCNFDIHFLNGRFIDDVEGNFTCFANRGASVVDYIIASTPLFKYIDSFEVDATDVSDHFH